MTNSATAHTPAPIPESPSAESTGIDRVEGMSRERFLRDHFRPKRPVVMPGLARDWPAFGKWSLAYFAERALAEPVTIERGNVLQGDTDFVAAGFRDYVRGLMSGEITPDRGYLSLFDIFERFPDLAADVDFSLLTDHTLWNYTFGWLGPAGTVTGYHIDWIDNILAQISGRKRLWLVPPGNDAAMYPSRKHDFRSTLSRMDPELTDPTEFPLFARVSPIEVTLEPGDCLFLPRGWWHRVKALDPSISVNTFGHDLTGIIFHQARAKAQHLMHTIGLRGDECTCHKRVNGKRVPK